MFTQERILIFLVIAMMVISSEGCVSVTMTSPELDKVAKEFSPPANQSFIYVMREGALVGGIAYMTIILNEVNENRLKERAFGFLKNDTYLLFQVPPGQYEVVIGGSQSKSNWRTDKYYLKEKIPLVTLPGHTYFIAAEFHFSTSHPYHSKLLPIDLGKQTLLEEDYMRAVSYYSKL